MENANNNIIWRRAFFYPYWSLNGQDQSNHPTSELWSEVNINTLSLWILSGALEMIILYCRKSLWAITRRLAGLVILYSNDVLRDSRRVLMNVAPNHKNNNSSSRRRITVCDGEWPTKGSPGDERRCWCWWSSMEHPLRRSDPDRYWPNLIPWVHSAIWVGFAIIIIILAQWWLGPSDQHLTRIHRQGYLVGQSGGSEKERWINFRKKSNSELADEELRGD